MSDIRGFVNGNSRGPQKTQLVTDLTEAYRKLNLVLERTETLSKNITANLKAAQGGPNGPNIATSGTKSAGSSMNFGFQNSGGGGSGDNPGSSMSFGSAVKNLGQNALASVPGLLAAGGAAAFQMVQPEKFIENQMLRTRFDFFSGQKGAGSMSFRNMMNAGTATSDMDAARAAGMAMSNGMMPTANRNGLFNTASTGAAQLSNMVPGAGLEGGMGAMIALNQAASVNKLRMIGIQVRDGATGLMKSYADIAAQLWEVIKRAHTGGGNITAEELTLSLQPGNSIASLLDQYFSGDPVLRQGIITELYKRATGGKGSSGYNKKDLQRMGILPDVANSMGKTNAALYGAVDAYTTPGVQGIMEANQIIADAAKMFEDNVDKFGWIVKEITKVQTLAGAGNGAGGTLIGAVAGFLTATIGNFFKDLGSGLISKILGKGVPGVPGTTTPFIPGGPTSVGALPTGLRAAPLYAVGMNPNIIDPTSDTGKRLDNYVQTTNPGMADKLQSARSKTQSEIDAYNKAGKYDFFFNMSHNLGAFYQPTGEGIGGEGIGPSDTYAPLKGGLTTPVGGEFGNKGSFRSQAHRGVDFRAKDKTPVFAIRGGKVVKSGQEGALGNMIRIQHADGFNTVYGHLNSQNVHTGDEVGPGDPIGLSGWSGAVYPKGPQGAHLHVAVERGGSVSDPMALLGGSSTPTANGVYSGASGNPLFGNTSTPLFGNSSTPLFGGAPSTGEGLGGEGLGGVSYGGVTVNINVPKGTSLDEHKLAREVKRILQDEEQLRMAVIR